MIDAAQHTWTKKNGWRATTPDLPRPAQLVLVFGAASALADEAAMRTLHERHPGALVAGASTAGEISAHGVADESLVATAIAFDDTKCRIASTSVDDAVDAYDAAVRLARELDGENLAHVLVFADGTQVNGTELVRGFRNELPRTVALTGGLAGDGPRFERTWTICNGEVASGKIVAVGLYGAKLRVGYGSLGGWDRTGVARRVTRAEGNIVLEIDDEPALAVYEKMLGPLAAELPASGLLFPLLVQTPEADFVRTLVGVDASRKALTFAGDVPAGQPAYFMRANFDRLVAGAQGAARDTLVGTGAAPAVAILVSCVGRKLVLKERTQDEIEAVRRVLGPSALLTGFYSYGEICPTAPGANCTLHNQTMTITTFHEQ